MLKRQFIFLVLILFKTVVSAQAVTADSLNHYLLKHQESVIGMVNGYEKISFSWIQLGSTLVGVIFLTFLTWKLWLQEWLKNHIQTKAKEFADDLLAMKQIPILVLSSTSGQPGNDGFLKDFFAEKKLTQVKFLPISDTVIPVTDFRYKIVFANNEDANLNKALVREYVKNGQAIFYFGPQGSWDYSVDTLEIKRQINFANSRAQIYGNLMSTLQFLDITQPKVKNV